MYLPINCFHRGSLALYAALWEELAVLRRDGGENALRSLCLCNWTMGSALRAISAHREFSLRPSAHIRSETSSGFP